MYIFLLKTDLNKKKKNCEDESIILIFCVLYFLKKMFTRKICSMSCNESNILYLYFLWFFEPFSFFSISRITGCAFLKRKKLWTPMVSHNLTILFSQVLCYCTVCGETVCFFSPLNLRWQSCLLGTLLEDAFQNLNKLCTLMYNLRAY